LVDAATSVARRQAEQRVRRHHRKSDKEKLVDAATPCLIGKASASFLLGERYEASAAFNQNSFSERCFPV